jgi:hypothetical protein
MEQLYEEKSEDEEEVEGEDEEDQTKIEEKVQQFPPKKPSKRVQKNHPSDQIIGNKDAIVETRRRICSLEQMYLALYLRLNQKVSKRLARMNFGISPWMKNWIK